MTNEQRSALSQSLQELAFDLKFSDFGIEPESLIQQAKSIVNQLIDSEIINAEVRYSDRTDIAPTSL